MAENNIKISDVDFNDIRSNLKTFLSSQSQFRDYDFEGSALSVLLDVLAYNTHYNAFYLNMLANEMFLDTAQQRDSIASLAKLVGYTSTSAIGAQATVRLKFNGVQSGISQFTIPKNAKFNTTIDEVTYTFVTPNAYTVQANNSVFQRDVVIKEGFPLQHKFVYTAESPVRFVIPNKNVDVSSIVVSVQESEADTTTSEWTKATNITQVFETSNVYFIEEAYDEKYEIIFGSGSLGKALKDGNIIIVDYLVCNADLTNGASVFSIEDLGVTVEYTSTDDLTVLRTASGGRGIESSESVKFNAPKNYQTQNRAVVQEDYQRIILNENSDLESVIAYGGEEADPPVYGKVYISAKPFGQQYLTNSRKSLLRKSILSRTPLSIDPLIIDPDYTYLIAEISTYYNSTQTKSTEDDIRQSILSAIDSFSSDNLERFGNRLRYSKFVRALDDITIGNVLNNDAIVKIQKRVSPDTQRAARLLLKYNNEIRESSLESSEFTYLGFRCYFDDDGLGNVRIYRFNDQKQKVFVTETAGTIDYTNGTVDVPSLRITAYDGIELKVTVRTKNLDVVPKRENILLLSSQDAKVTIVDENLR
jgi:hypothetical protein